MLLLLTCKMQGEIIYSLMSKFCYSRYYAMPFSGIPINFAKTTKHNTTPHLRKGFLHSINGYYMNTTTIVYIPSFTCLAVCKSIFTCN
jgi:hypothetical protein